MDTALEFREKIFLISLIQDAVRGERTKKLK